jgi:integrase
MPKERSAGAAKPYTYWRTYTVKDKNGMPVKKRTQRWMVQLDLGYDANGNRIRKTFTGKTSLEVRNKLKAARQEIRDTGALSDKSASLRKYVDLFLSSAQQRVAPSTWSGYRTCVEKYCRNWMSLRIADFVPTTIQRILDQAKADGRSVSYRHQLWTCLDQIFDLAMGDRVIQINPVKGVKVRGLSEVETGRKAFSVPELKSMLMATLDMSPSQAAIWWWRLFTGMRQSEILGAQLTYLHLDSDQPWYEVRRSLAEVPRDHGCGSKVDGQWPCGQAKGGLCPDAQWRIPDAYTMEHLTGRLCLVPPKSGKPRPVPLVPQLAQVMRLYLDATKDWPNPHGLIFRNRDGSPRLWHTDTKEFKELVEAAGMDPRERTGHETRCSAVTLMRRAGKDTKAIEEMIGHTSIKVDDIYTTIDAEQRADAVQAIPQALRLPQGLLSAGEELTTEDIEQEQKRQHQEWVASRKGIGGRKPQAQTE